METWMILYIASALILVFVAFNLFWRAGCSFAVKAAGCMLLLLISLKYEIYQFLGGAFFAPQLPRSLLLVFEACYGSLIILFFLFIIFDLYLLGNWIMARAGMPVPKSLPFGAIKCGLVCLSLCLGVWGVWQAVKVPDIKTINLTISRLPDALAGLKLVQLTDLHIGPILKKDWLAEVAAKTNSLDPDLILMTGDYIDGHVKEIGAELEPLAALKARYGVWAVTGNHEYYWNMREWREALENLGVNFLENEHRQLDINGRTLVLAGIPDLAAARFGDVEPDLAKALKDAPDAVRILLSHQPRRGDEYAGQIDLMLSGHTHGGLMFFLQPLIARFNNGFVEGLYPVAGGNVYVSPGTALWNGFSCRIGVPSEITLFVLEKGNTKHL